MKNKILLVLSFLSGAIFSQTVLGVDTIIKSGPIDKRINIVIIGDGYTAPQMSQFINNATSSANYLLNSSPFSNYKKYFNVFAIKVVSPQSGVSHPGTATDISEPASPVMSVVNNFNTCFDNYGTHRSIIATNAAAVYAVLASEFPFYDQVLVLGNSTEYGGTGGPIACSSIHSSAPEIVVHEMGHSFAGLADEYWAGTVFAQEKPNMTAASNTASVKWAPWLGTNATGIYPYGTSFPESNWFRPHENCKMQVLNVPFCSVCKEAIVEKIHSITSPIDASFPDTTWYVTDLSQKFKTILVKPNPNTLKRTWEINGNVVARNKDSIQVTGNYLIEGDNTVLFTVTDTTVLSRDTNHVSLHSYSVFWTISYSSVGIKEIKSKIEFSMFPNPASDVLNLKYTLLEDAEISISILDMTGKTVISERSLKTPPGEYKRALDISTLKEGNYILALRINNQVINNKFIIVK